MDVPQCRQPTPTRAAAAADKNHRLLWHAAWDRLQGVMCSTVRKQHSRHAADKGGEYRSTGQAVRDDQEKEEDEMG